MDSFSKLDRPLDGESSRECAREAAQMYLKELGFKTT